MQRRSIILFLLFCLCASFVHAESTDNLCMDGTLLFREDFGGNDPDAPRVSTTPVAGMTYKQATTDQFSSLTMYSGRYLVTKSGYCNGDTTGWTLPGADQSGLRSQWYIQDDHTYPNDYSLGYFMEIDGKGGNQQFYQTEINGLCEGSKLTFSAYVANVFTWFQYNWYTLNRGPVVAPCLKFVLTNPRTGEVLAEHSTQKIPFDANLPGLTDWQYSSAWHLVGMNFTVPVGVHTIRLSIYNNVSNGLGNDFALDDIEIRLCLPPVTIRGESEVCESASISLTADFTNDGILAEPLEYKWWYSADSITWTELSNNTATLSFAPVQKTDSGWYRVAVSGAGNIESVNCRTQSLPFLLTVVKECAPPPCPDIHYATRDTTVCDTLMPFTWHGLLFNEPGSQITILKDERECDTLQITWTLDTKVCYPEPITIYADTIVCDTLLPYTWNDHLFTTSETFSRTTIGSERQSVIYTYTLDTVHCERLYDIIVNKYNWQLLCHNVRVRELFPKLTVNGYQWYKDGIAIPNATEDNYSEQNELQGAFQLRLLMNNDRYVWSEILTIQPAQTLTPNRIRVYNHNGTLIYQSETETTLPYLPKGLYIIQIEQNGEQRIEKKLIP